MRRLRRSAPSCSSRCSVSAMNAGATLVTSNLHSMNGPPYSARKAHRRLARPADRSCPHPGDEWRKATGSLPARRRSGDRLRGRGKAKNTKNTKRRRPHHHEINRHRSMKINRASQPFSLNPTGTLSRRHWHNLSPSLTRANQRRTKCADALIAGAYLAGTNTRRVRRALAALFGGAVGKDTVSRVWRKVKGDWDAWPDLDE